MRVLLIVIFSIFIISSAQAFEIVGSIPVPSPVNNAGLCLQGGNTYVFGACAPGGVAPPSSASMLGTNSSGQIVPAIGTTVLTNGSMTSNLTGWSGTGLGKWNWNGTGTPGALHTTGDTTALSQSVTATNGVIQQIIFGLTGRTNGTVTMSSGTFTDAARYSNMTHTIYFTANTVTDIKFTPTTDFDGKITLISYKPVNDNSILTMGKVICYKNIAQPIYSVPGWTTGGMLAETTVASCNIPGNLIGPNGSLNIISQVAYTNASSNKTFKWKLGGTNFATLYRTTFSFDKDYIYSVNRNSTGSQQTWPNGLFGSGTTTPTPTTIDTSIDQPLLFTFQTQAETPGSTVTAGTGNGTLCSATIAGHPFNTGEYAKISGGSNCSTSGNPNGDPVALTKFDANTITYLCSCNGNMVATFPTVQRYSAMQSESFSVFINTP